MAIHRFPFHNTDELAKWCRSHRSYQRAGDSEKSWTGEYYDESCVFLEKGNTAMVPEAEKLLEKIISDLPINRHDWVNDVSGAFPDVPAFLSGNPENMRRRVPQPRNNAPIKVFVNLTSSAGVSWEDLMKRGITILALILQLQKFRQVELWVYTGTGYDWHGDDKVSLCKLQTSPIRLSEAAYCMTSTGFARNLMYNVCQTNGSNGTWPNEKNERILCNAGPDDLVIQPWSLYNAEITEMIEKPLDWINKQVKKFVVEQEENY